MDVEDAENGEDAGIGALQLPLRLVHGQPRSAASATDLDVVMVVVEEVLQEYQCVA